MLFKSSRQGDVALIEVGGLIDTRASTEFERQTLEVFDSGSRLIAIDVANVDLVTSAGIRVLVMLAQRLQGAGGALVLCALGPKVRTVFEVAGLMRQFRVVATAQEAVAQLSSRAPAAASASASRSKLSRLARHLLGDGGAAGDAAAAPAPATRSPLSSHIAQLLDK